MIQQNLKLKGIFDICEANGLDGRYLHELWNATTGKVVDHNANFYLKSDNWVNEYNFATQKGLDLLAEVNTFLKNKEIPQKIKIDEVKVIEYNEIFPNQKSGSGKRMRCNIKELTKAFQYFFKLYPETTWPIILQATELYVQDQSKDDYKFCRTAKYFCIKFKQPGQPESELIEYVERVTNGDTGEEQKAFFETKVY